MEEADKPVTPPELEDKTVEPDMKRQPVEWAQFKLQQFFDAAVVDPVDAVKSHPIAGAAAATLFATVLGMMTVCESSGSDSCC